MFIAVFAVADSVLAADLWGGQEGAVESALGLGDAKDPRVVAASIIRVALGFLGVIALGLIIYAGFLWMTSAGNEQKIEQAKKILKNALIGLIIILASFGIVSFIINKLSDQIGAGGPGDGSPQFSGGIGALGNCSIQTVYPEPDQKEVPRNTAIVVTFREEVEQATICNDANTNGVCDNGELVIPENVRIFKTGAGDGCEITACGDNIVDAEVMSTDNKTFVFVPKNYLGSPSEYIWHTVYLSNDILKLSDGKGIFSTCKTDYFEWQFEVSNKIDLEPPQVKEGGIFPAPDNQADAISTISAAVQATGGITVNSNPYAYAAADVQNPTGIGGSEAASVSGSYNCLQDGTINVSINGVTNKADVSGPLGIVTGDDITDNIASLG
ncbi:MAG: pilin, partial [Nitrospirota bacterium]|nr:pilin [Nitrospirota bacterium]